MQIQTKKSFQLPQLLGSHTADWPNASLDSLESNLIAKLPYVRIDSKSHERNQGYLSKKGAITAFKEFTISQPISHHQNKANHNPKHHFYDFFYSSRNPTDRFWCIGVRNERSK